MSALSGAQRPEKIELILVVIDWIVENISISFCFV